ncbi:MAG: hypothetical protein ACRDGM_10170 [bacterium]
MQSPYDPPHSRVADGTDLPPILATRPTIKLFQWLVVASVLTSLVFFFLPAVPLPVSLEVAALRAKSGYGAILPGIRELIAWIFLPLWLLASVGLFFFQAWARTLFAVLYVVGLLLRFAQGVTVSLPVEGFVGEIVSLLDGAILVLAFTAPLDAYFRRRAP